MGSDFKPRKTLNPPPPSVPYVPSRFRARDSIGALRPRQAEIDNTFSRGYAQGLEEARAESLDLWRTTLLRALESKFGEIDEPTMDQIALAEQSSIERWILELLGGATLDELFSASRHAPPFERQLDP